MDIENGTSGTECNANDLSTRFFYILLRYLVRNLRYYLNNHISCGNDTSEIPYLFNESVCYSTGDESSSSRTMQCRKGKKSFFKIQQI